MILVTRKRTHPATIAYIERRLQEGKTRREANRCLKRYLARNLYRLLEHGAPLADLTNIEASLAQASAPCPEADERGCSEIRGCAFGDSTDARAPR